MRADTDEVFTAYRPRSRRRKRVRAMAIACILLASAAVLLYSVSPYFWHQYFGDMLRPQAAAPAHPNPRHWPDKGIHGAWLGHATVLLKVDGTTILTDPIFSARAGIEVGPLTLGVKRRVKPALRIEELPPIDIVLLSHAHMDHFDLPTLRKLENRRTIVVTARFTADLLRADRWGAVRELPWGERTEAAGLAISAFEVNHWGTRLRKDRHRRYNGYVLEKGTRRILFVGDTGPTEALARFAEGTDLAILPIGCYDPWWPRHMKPEEAWAAARDGGARAMLPIHHSTFNLSSEPVGEPMRRLLAAAGNDSNRIGIRRIGEEVHID